MKDVATYQMSPIQMGVSYSIERVLRLLLGDEFDEGEPPVAAVELFREAQALDLSKWTEQLPDVLLGRLKRLQEEADIELRRHGTIVYCLESRHPQQ
jgi:hypothetical protein